MSAVRLLESTYDIFNSIQFNTFILPGYHIQLLNTDWQCGPDNGW